MDKKVLIYGKDSWPYTSEARKDYEQSGKPFEYINVQKDRKQLEKMLQLTKGVREVPVILEQGNVTIGYNGGSWGV